MNEEEFIVDLLERLQLVINAEISNPGHSYTLQLLYEIFLSVDNYTSELTERLSIYAHIKKSFENCQLFQFMYELDTHTLGAHNFQVGDNIPLLTNVVQHSPRELH